MRVGIVLGTTPITPLEFWVGVEKDHLVQLDDVLYAETQLANGQRVKFYGVVQEVQKFLEGAQWVYDAHLAIQGVIPVNVAYIAKVALTRVEPEFFVPPSPGDPVYFAEGEELEKALYYDQMKVKIPAGLTRSGQVVYLNYHVWCGNKNLLCPLFALLYTQQGARSEDKGAYLQCEGQRPSVVGQEKQKPFPRGRKSPKKAGFEGGAF
jgi:hypothetical protein